MRKRFDGPAVWTDPEPPASFKYRTVGTDTLIRFLATASEVTCPLCQRPTEGLMEKHHLRTRRTDKDETEYLCRDCHQIVHGLFSNRELRDTRLQLDSVEGLLANERVTKALSFVRRLPVGATLRMRLSNHVRGHKRKWNG